MNERDLLFLAHIREAIADIEAFVIDGRASFMADRSASATYIAGITMTKSDPRMSRSSRMPPA